VFSGENDAKNGVPGVACIDHGMCHNCEIPGEGKWRFIS
jgi:hypothetical protein